MSETNIEERFTHIRYSLASDFKKFCRYFFKLIFDAEFDERPHVTLIQEELLKVYHGEITFLNINIHPGSFKSTILALFAAWAMARDPRCAFIYASYTFDLATKQTTNILRIMSHPQFNEFFGVKIDPLTSSKSNFRTTKGGSVFAAGTYGTVTGFDAGRPFGDSKEFLGAVLMDDCLKPSDAFSTTLRAQVKRTYYNTLLHRRRSRHTPMISIAQRLHEDDLVALFLKNEDGNDWKHLILPFLQADGTVLDPKLKTKEEFLELIRNPRTAYDAASQYMQNPIIVGDSLFKEEQFKILDELPPFISIFITGDVAETENKQNDASAFSAWGVFDVMINNKPSGQMGLVWLDCVEIWVRPSDLLREFMGFYAEVTQKYGEVSQVWIENKSMGVMLNDFLMQQPGVCCMPLIRTNKMSKIDRISQAQPIVSAGLICFKKNAKHLDMIINHMLKISHTKSHLLDDIADTLADAVDLVYHKKIIANTSKAKQQYEKDIAILLEKGIGSFIIGQPRA